MKSFKEIRQERLIKQAHKLLDSAELLVSQIIQNAHTAEAAKTKKAA